jgi:toxin FitB
MYLLDTNVVSELRRTRPHGAVLSWLRDMPAESLRLSAVTIGELQAGVEVVRETDPTKAAEIEAWIDKVALVYNIIPTDAPAFRRWAQIFHRRSGDLVADAMIAATAEIHNLTVATRNIRDFETFGTKTFNPFEYRIPKD